HYIYWNATDDNPSNYTVTRNNDIIDEGIWFSGSLFIIDVSGLFEGEYLYTIEVGDLDGNITFDSVHVFVSGFI
ncbi:MAG: hypothetical protein KGD63_13365, partial [Candidatus Lokiarchaeota archaeon]|nr:hypothetical protein [Candidatus Lokiarchaeota archaeon]